MSHDQFFDPGHCEGLKAGVHLLLFGTAVAAAAYNLGAWLERGGWRLAMNTAIYGTLAGFEAHQVLQHTEAAQACRR